MRFIHLILGIAIIASSLATVVAAFLPAVKEELFDNLSATAAGLLVIQVVVGFFLFTSQTCGAFNAFVHILPVVVSIAALFGARAVQGDRRKILVGLAAFLVLVAAVVSYITGVAAIHGAGC